MKRTSRKPRSEPETVSVGNVTVKLYKRQRLTTTGKCRTIFELANYTGGSRRLRGFTDHAKRSVSAEMALKLGRLFNVSPELWMGIQADYDLEVARRHCEQRIRRDVHPLAELQPT